MLDALLDDLLFHSSALLHEEDARKHCWIIAAVNINKISTFTLFYCVSCWQGNVFVTNYFTSEKNLHTDNNKIYY